MNGTLCILVVDDEEDMGWALERIIEAGGHRCVVTRSAHEALQALAGRSFHLALVDVKLPDMEGLELVQHLHRMAPGLPCVLVSGYFYADDDQVQTKLRSGEIAGFIGKPFLLGQVQQTIAGAASRS